MISRPSDSDRLTPVTHTVKTTIEIFRAMRKVLAPQQGQERKTWVQAIVIGDVALVGVPGESFTYLGQEIKRRSPYRDTFVFEIDDKETKILRGDKVVTFKDARMQKNEKIAVTTDHDFSESIAIVIRLDERK